MSDIEDERPAKKVQRTPREVQLIGRLRFVSGIVFLGLIVYASVVQISGRPVGDVFFGTLVGAFLLMIGIEAVARRPF